MRRNNKVVIAGIILTSSIFACFLSSLNATPVYAEGGSGSGSGSGSSSAPNITITESIHNGNLATAELAKDGSISTVDFSYTITPNGNVGNYEVYIGTDSSTLIGRDQDDNVIEGANIESMPLEDDPSDPNISASILANGHWGYRTSNLVSYPTSTPNANIPNATIDDNASYKALPVVNSSNNNNNTNNTKYYGDKLKDTSNNTTISGNNATRLAVQVAAKGDATLPAGKYKGKVILSVVATPKTVTYMQDFTVADCSNIAKGDTITLADSRDEKQYLVSRLADGNCWMVQNLALEGGTQLDSTNSNLDAGQTYTLPTSSQSFSPYNDRTTPYMFNGSHVDATYDTAGCWPPSDKTIAEYCTESTKTNNNNNNSGAYYSFDAATAGKYTSRSSGYTTQSICPKKWVLPSSGETNTQDKSFSKLYAGAAGSGYASNTTDFDAVWQPGFGGIIDSNSLFRSSIFGY